MPMSISSQTEFDNLSGQKIILLSAFVFLHVTFADIIAISVILHYNDKVSNAVYN